MNINNSYSMNKCDYCDKIFCNKYALKTHLNTAEFCLKARGEQLPIFECYICGKKLSTKGNLDAHIKTCREKLMKVDPTLIDQRKENEISYQQSKQIALLQKEMLLMSQQMEDMKKEISQLKNNTKLITEEQKEIFNPKKKHKKLESKSPLDNNDCEFKLVKKLDLKNCEEALNFQKIQNYVKLYTREDFVKGPEHTISFIIKLFKNKKYGNVIKSASEDNIFYILTTQKKDVVWKKGTVDKILNTIVNELGLAFKNRYPENKTINELYFSLFNNHEGRKHLVSEIKKAIPTLSQYNADIKRQNASESKITSKESKKPKKEQTEDDKKFEKKIEYYFPKEEDSSSFEY